MTPALKAALCGGAAVLLAGCGGGNAPLGQAITIAVQPLSQTVPIGQTATFTVKATGSAPLNYQWIENGTAISGATGASYTTPVVELDAGGSTTIGSFQVTVSNTVNSVTSNTATLTAGPRGPQAGDLRYLLNQQVDLPGFMTTAGVGVNFLGITEESIANSVGSPLTLGSTWFSTSGCLWEFNYWFLPSPMAGLAMYYQLDGNTRNQSYTSFLQSVAQPNIVITSMDLEPACQVFGVSWVLTANGGGFDQRIETIPMGANFASSIQNQAALDGSDSRIITAATIDDAEQQAVVLSYGWTGDTKTIYESQAYVVPPSQIGLTAKTLANEGYFISAFGGNDTDGYILVGMRVKGDSLPRPIWGPGVNTAANPLPGPYSTLIVWDNEQSLPDGGWQIWEQ